MKPGGQYRKGRALEKRAQAELEEKGYLVIRAAGSKGPVDLVAIPSEDAQRRDGFFMRLIQVKARRHIRPADREALKILSQKFPVTPILVELWTYEDRAPGFKRETVL